MSKILLVDDSSTMRKIIKTALSNLEVKEEILEAENGAEALELIQKDADIDCMFLDINMPVMGGFELIKELKDKNLFDRVNVIINSTEVSQMKEEFIDELGVTGVIPKPLKRDEFNNILIPLLDLIRTKPKPKYQFKSNVLIVDASISVRKVIKKILQSLGCNNVFEAKHGKEALEVVAENEINVILTDVDMPVMDGISFLKHLDKCMLLDEIKTIIISSKLGIEEVLSDIEIADTINKPFKLKTFQIVLQSLLKSMEGIVDEEPKKESKEGSFEFSLEEEEGEESENSEGGDGENAEDEESNELKVTMSMSDTFEKYLNSYESCVEKNRKDLMEKNTLDYLLMKRFILTAYNNLFEIDAHIENKNVKDAKDKLLSLEKVYEEFDKNVKMPIKYLYDVVFLENQREYMKCFSRLEDNKRMIGVYNGQVKTLDSKVKFYKEELEKIRDKNSVTYSETLTNYKKNNKSLADTMFKVGQLKEENKSLLDLTDAFRDKYYLTFVEDFKRKVKDVRTKLLKILNVSCYGFDTLLWQQAKLSREIARFFQSAKIEGGYSSQTFLEYYLRTIDKDKMSDETQKLFELLEYLQKESNKNIVIIYPDTQEINKMKTIIESSNSAFKVQGFIGEEKFLEMSKLEPDLVILDYNMRGFKIDEFLVKYKNKFKLKTKAINALLLMEKTDKDVLMKAMEEGVLNAKLKNYALRNIHNTSKVQFMEKIKSLV